MIDLIFQLLNSDHHYGQSELIEIAKGKHKLPESLKEMAEQVRRNKKWQR